MSLVARRNERRRGEESRGEERREREKERDDGGEERRKKKKKRRKPGPETLCSLPRRIDYGTRASRAGTALEREFRRS